MNARHTRRGRPARSDQLWIQPEMNDEFDVRKYSRALLALAMHQAAKEAAAQAENPADGEPNGGSR
jgi:hypothetical protein